MIALNLISFPGRRICNECHAFSQRISTDGTLAITVLQSRLHRPPHGTKWGEVRSTLVLLQLTVMIEVL